MTKKQKILFALLLTGILVIFLLRQINITQDFSGVFKEIRAEELIAAFSLYFLAYFFQALRFRLFLMNRFNLFSLFNIVCLHNFFNNILPLRTGEFSYLYLIEKSEKVRTGENIASLILARFLDFFAISLFFFISIILLLSAETQFFQQLFLCWVLFLIPFAVLFVLILFYPIKVSRFAEIFFSKTVFQKFKIFNFIQQKIKEILGAIQNLKSRKLFFFSTITSLAIWLSLYLTSFLLIRGLGLNLNFWQIIFVSSFPLFSLILPIQGIAGFGNIEGSWTLGFMILGIPKVLAVSSGFILHFIILIYTFILAFLGYVLFKRK